MSPSSWSTLQHADIIRELLLLGHMSHHETDRRTWGQSTNRTGGGKAEFLPMKKRSDWLTIRTLLFFGGLPSY